MKAETIITSYAEELKLVDQHLLDIFRSDVFLIPLVGQHILGSGGKRIRPLFLLMSADLCGYRGEDRALFGAIIEAIHTASLLHDDVIDGAETRRGRPAANALWGNQVVILIGDYLYSNALRIAVSKKNQRAMEALSNATTRMTEGEILQLNKTGDPDITLDEYYAIVSAKTGVLISAACRIAAILARLPSEQEEALAAFGLKAGIAFQLEDDILDYVANQADLGKRLGKDLEEGKITMPMIHLLRGASGQERDEIKAFIKETAETSYRGGSVRSNGDERLNWITDMFEKYNAINESLWTARSLVEEAKSCLDVFSASKNKEALLAMADYVTRRDR